MNEWISVNDKLPERGKLVIVFVDGKVGVDMFQVAPYEPNEPWSCYVAKFITHWMPLPPPPEATK